ncbi:MAG: NAD(P)-dependent oxidoreductase [Sphingobacteriales bacterium]
MKLVIFGATGQVGLHLVKQAIWRGHYVRAFGRNIFDIKFEDDKLELIKGAVFDEKDVLEAIQGCDAVLSALGGAADGTDKTRSLGIKNIIAQMKKANVKRIIALGGSGILNASEHKLFIETEDYPKQFLPVGKEHFKAYEYLRDSNLDWTVVCAPNLANNDPTGNYFTNKDYPPQPNNYKINTSDLAMFMLNELERNDYMKCRVGISN